MSILCVGEELDGMVCGHPLYRDKSSPLLPGNHVTNESGTGLVHTAPAHGIDDYNISRLYNLSLVCNMKYNTLCDFPTVF